MGEELMPPGDFNQDGYWEYYPLVRFHEKLLSKIQSTWYAPTGGFNTMDLVYEFGEEARKLVSGMDRNQCKAWCWKDPRMLSFLDFWQEILRDRDVFYIFPFRNPLSVATSLYKRDKIPPLVSLALWEYLSAGLFNMNISRSEYTFIDYDKLIRNPAEICRQIFNILQLQVMAVTSSATLDSMTKAVRKELNFSDSKITYELSKRQIELYLACQKGSVPSSIYSSDPEQSKKLKQLLEFYKEILFSNYNILVAQLFYASDQPVFREADSIIVQIREAETALIFKIPDSYRIGFLRFDPINTCAEVKIRSTRFYFKGNEVPVHFNTSSNGILNNDLHYFSDTADPQINFVIDNNENFEMDEVRIEIEYISKGIDFLPDVIKRKNDTLDTLQKHLAELNKAVLSGNNLISAHIETISGLTQDLYESQQKNNELGETIGKNEILLLSHMSQLAETRIKLGEVRQELVEIQTSFTYRLSRVLLFPFLFFSTGKHYLKLRSKISTQLLMRNIVKSRLFDAIYYLKNNPDVQLSGMQAAKHYLLFGGFEGRNPSREFDSEYYLECYPDVKENMMNPLLHYIAHGKKEGRTFIKRDPQPANLDISPISQGIHPESIVNDEYLHFYNECLATAQANQSLDYVEDLESKHSLQEPEVKLIAFYLPQYHPVPENDTWWGKGFTEWTNVSKAIPQFVGHYQPRLPGELGFYDLRNQETMSRQIELAKKYGIHGFCFHYYWFSGKRLLEKPLNQFLADPGFDFPFCICWANENWTRRWDGSEDDILISQEHSFENDKNFIADLEPLLRDPRYLRINGRPVIIIYRPMLLDKPAESAIFWKKFCLERNLGDPIITGGKTFGFTDPASIGFDAAVEFPPHNITYEKINSKINILNKNYKGSVFDYREMVRKSMLPLGDNLRLFRTVAPSWDNESRKPGRGHSFAFASPKLYRRWLEEICCQEMYSQPENERVVFINGWNEWAESACLEPDRKYGYAYLQATTQALQATGKRFLLSSDEQKTYKPLRTNKTAVILHIYYMELFPEIAAFLGNIKEGFDVFISMPESHQVNQKIVFEVFPQAYLLLTENRGRDIAPFIDIYRMISSLGYECLLKLHTKKSIHRNDGNSWREDILNKIVGSPQCIEAAINELNSKTRTGIIGPFGHVVNKKHYWGFNKNLTLKLASHCGIDINENSDFLFIAGSMFWAKPGALSFLNLLPVSSFDFEPEPIPADGTLAHAIERLIGLAACESGYLIKEISEKGIIGDPDKENSFLYAEKMPETFF